MSHYDCVLPIDFERLRDIVMPAWIEFIAGKRAPRAFADEFAPWEVGIADKDDWGEDNWLEPFDVPHPYIEWFRLRPMTAWVAEDVRRDVGELLISHNRFSVLNSLPWCATDLLALAIKQSCAVELPGLYPFLHSEFWYRLHEPPFVQVAWAKNSFKFLEELYEWVWQESKGVYFVKRSGKIAESTYRLLDLLFFNVRVLPGTPILTESLVWEAYNGLSFPGFLTPEETQELAGKLPEINTVLQNFEGNVWEFDLFTDCLQRSAHCHVGLVTLYDGL